MQRSLINWLFLLMTGLLIYLELRLSDSKVTKAKLVAWRSAIWLSAVVILANMLNSFCTIENVSRWEYVKYINEVIPDWMKNQEIFGIPPLESKSNSVFLPYLIFLISSSYISG